MRGAFKPDGWFIKYGGKLWDLIWLNLLTLLCCLPCVTIGASLTAMHYVLLKIYRDEESGITRAFFKSFRQNFLQAFLTELLFAAVCYPLLIALYLSYRQHNGILTMLLVIVLFLLLCVGQWAVILQSRYENHILNKLKHSLAACLAYPGRTLGMCVAVLLPFFLLLFTYWMLVPMLILGLSLPGLAQTFLYNGVFQKLESGDQSRTE